MNQYIGRIKTWLLLLTLSIGLAACAGSDHNVQASTTTLGQELMDLDESYKQGLLTEREYRKAKQLILRRYE